MSHIGLPGEATGDKQQVVGDIDGHATAMRPAGASMNSFGDAALEVAAEDVAGEQVAGVEGGPAAGGDALGRGGTR